jgi:hypothetical protein
MQNGLLSDRDTVPTGGFKRTKYFLVWAGLLLAAVIAGFSPTFFLRAWMQEVALPPYLILHGVILTAWFILVFGQTILIARDNTALHRQLGLFGAALAPIVVATALMAIFGVIPNAKNNGFNVVNDRLQIEFIIWSDLGALLAFIVFVTAGLTLRRRAAAHKRFMLLGSVSIMSPAFIRLADLPPFNSFGGVLFVLAVFVSFALSLLIHDIVSMRRIHRATLLGLPFFFFAILGSAFIIPGSSVGRVVDPLFVSRP